IRCIENAFVYYGGYPKEILFDNMKQVVNRVMIEGNTEERRITPAMQNFANYYGFDIRLCRVRRPQEKGKVERFVNFAKSDLIPRLPAKTGLSLKSINEMAIDWCNEVNSLVHETTNEIPFERLPNEKLHQMPVLCYTGIKTAKVSAEGYIHYKGHVFQVDNGLANCEGIIKEMYGTIFLIVDHQKYILGHYVIPKAERKEFRQPVKRKKPEIQISRRVEPDQSKYYSHS
ncbi:MAG: hypothetical protein ACI4UK_06570, partial [Floccifex sp.]